MAKDRPSKGITPSISLVGDRVSDSTYNEVFLNCTDGYCVFDENQRLQAFSSEFPTLYPTVQDKIAIGMSYAEYMRVFYEEKAIRNLGDVASADEWVDLALKACEQKNSRHIHHLHDGRWLQIYMNRASTGQWLFIAMDITELRHSQMALEQSHERFHAFAHLSMDWFWELDENLCYVYHSSHNASLTGVSADELVGVGRIESIENVVIHNEAFREHNLALRERRGFNLILEWPGENNDTRYSNIVCSPEFDHAGNFTGYMGCGREVTDEIRVKSRLNHLADHDDLTGLVNRRAFEKALTEQLRRVSEQGQPATLCFIDLDQFKLVNDGGGHEAGDELLKEVANSFCRQLGRSALVARLGGDEFGVILQDDMTESLNKINKLIRYVSSTPFDWKQRNYTIGASAGLATIDDKCRDISELMSHADTACYMAKNAGRNQAQMYIYDEYFQDPASLELKQVNLLRNAMDNDGLLLYLQPIKPLQFERAHMHFEVLLRLRDVDGQVKSAGEFIPVAEKYDLMTHLDRWVLDEALRILDMMTELRLDVSFSINLSGNTLSNKRSLELYRSLIEASGIKPELMVFEVTETAAIKNVEVAKNFITEMKRFGCGFSLDDFGSGLSSFGYLKDLSVDYLKIDGSFVKTMRSDVTCRAIVSAFNQLSHELGMRTVAEFVEDNETEQLLTELGVDFAQGYGVGKPQSAQEYIEFLLENSNTLPKAG